MADLTDSLDQLYNAVRGLVGETTLTVLSSVVSQEGPYNPVTKTNKTTTTVSNTYRAVLFDSAMDANSQNVFESLSFLVQLDGKEPVRIRDDGMVNGKSYSVSDVRIYSPLGTVMEVTLRDKQ